MQGDLDLRGGENPPPPPPPPGTDFIMQEKDAMGRPIPTSPELVEGFEEVMPEVPGPQQPPPGAPPGGQPVPTGQQGEVFDTPQGVAPAVAPSVCN